MPAHAPAARNSKNATAAISDYGDSGLLESSEGCILFHVNVLRVSFI